MAIKKFSAYIAEAPAADYVAPKDDDAEVKGYKPRSKGEEDFANAHMVQKNDYYAVPGQDHVFNGSVKEVMIQPNNGEPVQKQGSSDVNQPTGGGDSKRGADKSQGDKITTVKEEIQLDEREDTATQVARELKKMGVKSNAKEADIIKKIPDVLKKMGLGNNKLIKRDPDFIGDVLDSMNEEFDLIEGKVMDGLKKIVDKKSAGSVKFENGKTLKVDMTTANAMLNLHKKINDKNKAKMADQIEKSPEVFMKLMDVAFGGK